MIPSPIAILRLLGLLSRLHPSGGTLIRYFDGELPYWKMRIFAAHIAECQECGGALREVEVLLRPRQEPDGGIPEELMSETLRSILSAIGAAPPDRGAFSGAALRDLAVCLGAEEAVAMRRAGGSGSSDARLAALLGTPAATAFRHRCREFS